ncbi:MAG: hypothetical protein GY786_15300, partial [Proteobacteria bacterium]|nr:hypothetical protein [Pseudomonadota bacterium]
ESQVNNLSAGNYSFTVEDALGCSEEYEVSLTEPPALEGIEIDCEGLTEGELVLLPTGGSPPFLYSVDGGDFKPADVFDELIPGGSYLLTIQDANGCEYEQDFIMPGIYDQMFNLPEELKVLVGEQFPLEVQLNFPESLLASVIWAPSDNLSCTDCLNPIFSSEEQGKETYFVQVTDIFGCRTFASIVITVKPEI